MTLHTNDTVISILVLIPMSALAAATTQSIGGENDPNKRPPIAQPRATRRSHIREHPFMKEVRFHR